MRKGLLVLVIAASATSACVSPLSQQKPTFGNDGGDRTLPQGVSAKEASLTQKPVNGKEEPATLISADRMSCVVTAKKFRETALGDKVWCAWH